MPRPKKRENDPEKVMQELLDTAISLYNERNPHPSLAEIGTELDMNPLKIRKLLITAGVYESPIAENVVRLHNEGLTVEQLMEQLNLSRASVQSHLPYTKQNKSAALQT